MRPSTVAVAVGALLGVLIVGSLKMTLAAVGVLLVAVGAIYPRLILYALVVLGVFLSETTYGVNAADSVFRLSSIRLDPIHLNLYEILVYCLLAILIARRAVGTLPREVSPWITVPCLVTAFIFLVQFLRALLSGVPYFDALYPFNAEFVLPAVAVLWCACELLGDSAKRLQLLDLLYVCASGRAAFALARYAFGSGDTADYYREIGVKVALWESADHLVFVFLIAVAIAAWVTERVSGWRQALWLCGSLLMALTVLLSFRRTGWFGLVAALILVTILLIGRYRRSLILIPALLVVVAGVAVWSFQRFSAGGSLLVRLFPDVASGAGPTRQDEWALAWRAIVENPLFGDLMARRAASLYTPWSTTIVHNAFLFAWLKLGLGGLLSLGFLAGVVVVYAVRGVRTRGPEQHISVGLVAIVPFALFLSTFATPLIEFRTMFFLALAGALAARVVTSSRVASGSERGPMLTGSPPNS